MEGRSAERYVTNGAQRGALSSLQSSHVVNGVVNGAAAMMSHRSTSRGDGITSTVVSAKTAAVTGNGGDVLLGEAVRPLSPVDLDSALREVEARISRLQSRMLQSSGTDRRDGPMDQHHSTSRRRLAGDAVPHRHVFPYDVEVSAEQSAIQPHVPEGVRQHWDAVNAVNGGHRGDQPSSLGHPRRGDGVGGVYPQVLTADGRSVVREPMEKSGFSYTNVITRASRPRDADSVVEVRSSGVRQADMHSSFNSLVTVSDSQLSRMSSGRYVDYDVPRTVEARHVEGNVAVSMNSGDEYFDSTQYPQRQLTRLTGNIIGRQESTTEGRRRSEGMQSSRHRGLERHGGDRHVAGFNEGNHDQLTRGDRRGDDDDRKPMKVNRRRDPRQPPREERTENGRIGRYPTASGDPPSSGGDSDDDKSGRGRGYRKSGDASRRRHRRKHYSSDGSSDAESSGNETRTRYSSIHKRWLKPEKFDGRGSLETFLYMFENCAEYNRWSSKDKAAYLRWSLTGIAAQLLWGTSELSYSELVEKLKGRFGGKGMEEKFQNELRYRRRAKGESLRELAQDIRRLMALAYPGEKSSLAEHIARDSFLTALDDPDFELKIREKEPVDLDTAVKTALRFEVFKGAVEASSSGRHRVTRQIVTDESTGVSLEEFGVRLGDLERRLQESARSSQGRKPEAGQMAMVRNDEDVRDESRSKVKRNRKVANASMKEGKGHAAAAQGEARQTVKSQDGVVAQLLAEKEALNKEVERLRLLEQLRKAEAPPANAAGSQQLPSTETAVKTAPRATGGCWTCGVPGHFSRNCPYRAQYPQQVTNGPGASFQCHGARKGTEDNCKRATYLRAVIANQERDCLLDTGSEISLLPAGIVDRSLVMRTNHTLKAANGTSIPVLGQATVPIQVGSSSSTVTGLVSEHVAEVMLGIEWLTENQVIWDFNSATIWINGQYIKLHAIKSEQRWCRRTVLHRDVTIPPRSQMDLPTKVVFNGRPDVEGDMCWVTESSPIVKGVYVARTVIPTERYTDIPVRVVNTQPCAVTIGAGTTVSNLFPSSVVSSMTPAGGKRTERPLAADGTPSDSSSTPEFIEVLVNSVDETVPADAVAALKKMLIEHKEAFSTSEYDIGLTNAITHRIDTGDAKPVRQPLRRHPPAHVEAISEHIDTMLKQGVIEPAASPWASTIVLVRKKDSTYRCCIDYRQLNAVTTRDAYPLPRIDVCLDTMTGARWFSTFDLRSSYHQVRVAPEDTDKTAFICPQGMFKFRTMPFGLVNAGATFQRLMDVLMTGLNFDICLVYLDDIVVFSATIEQHLERLDTVLTRLKSAGLKLKPEKSAILQKSVSFLGHTISDAGIGTDPMKTQAIRDWPTPRNLKEVRAFVGLASYYRRFVKDFARVAGPLHDLTKKTVSSPGRRMHNDHSRS